MSSSTTSSSSQQTNEASIVYAIKDQAVGAIKEVVGSVIGNTHLELEGKAQKVHGKNEYEFAKAFNAGETEPEKFQRAYHSDVTTASQETNQSVESEPSQLSGWKDQALGAMKDVVGSATANQELELKGKAQNIHGRNETEFAKAQRQGLSEPEHYAHGTKTTEQPEGHVDTQESISMLAGWKDQALGAMKGAIGAATGNQDLELKGKAQNIHGRNEAEFAKAQFHGLSEPEHFAHGKKTDNFEQHREQQVEPESFSALSAVKDVTIGAIKESFGSATGNTNTEIAGLAQQMHGRNQAEFIKAQNEGLYEPEHYVHGSKTISDEQAKGEVENQSVSTIGALKDKAIGSVKEMLGAATGNQELELKGKAQNIHGHNEAEFAKAQRQGLSEPEHYAHGTKSTSDEHAKGEVEDQSVSTIGALKDKAMGSVKEMLGAATGNHDLELKGKAQNIHGHNEAEFAKAQRQGLSEPEHYAHGTKTTSEEHAKGEVEDQSVSSVGAIKDKALGSVKEMIGAATGNQDLELKGKAQNIHGHNEAEFAKAQRQGLSEPEHYAHGMKTTQNAEGEVDAQEPSKMSGWKDQAVGSVKETFGSATNNQKLEIEGKAQKIHGSNQCSQAEHNPINA
jgi:uncharacterized protein YjbJ (UPF0337 family)